MVNLSGDKDIQFKVPFFTDKSSKEKTDTTAKNLLFVGDTLKLFLVFILVITVVSIIVGRGLS